MIRSMSADDIKASSCSDWPHYHININVAQCQNASPSKLDISIGCSTTCFREIPTALRAKTGIIFKEDQGSINPRFISTSFKEAIA